MPPKTLREKFTSLDSKRGDVVDSMYLHAQFTIPRLFPERYYIGTWDYDDLPETYSDKARNNIIRLANMMVNALMPPNDVPFFELKISPELSEEQAAVLRDPIAEVEAAVLDTLQASNLRTILFEGLQHCIVMKDSLIHQVSDTKFKLYHPAHFILRRDGEGEIKEYWTVDWVVTDLLNDDLKGLNGGRPKNQMDDVEPLYTHIYYKDDEWKVEREFRDVMYETDKTYKILPYYHFGWTPISGENHSRSLVEENFGTIRSLEMVSKALAEGLAAASEGRILIDPSSTTTEDDFLGTTNWSFISARPGSIEAWQPNAIPQISVTLEAKRDYENELDEAFLATSASDLRGERVTAYQTNQVVNERAQALGGTLATLEQDLERIVNRTIFVLIEKKKLTKDFRTLMDEGAVSISISSGIDALSRQADVQRLESMLSLVYQSGDPEAAAVLKKGAIYRAIARNSGLDMDQFIYTDEEVAANQQAAQQAALAQQGGQQAIQSVGAITENTIGQ